MRAFVTVVFAAILLASCAASEPSAQEQAKLEADFAESMRNVVMEGHFTVSGRGDNAKLRPERYEIEKAVHVTGDLWTIHARIQYGDHDFTAPIPVKLLWAGDTPVISLTDVSLPGSDGSFTARVVIFRDHYSGMWWHGETGGNQFGQIVRASE
ncbi:MAG: hypothetical protein H6509_15650 [Bryobacterales bacterium]|nr:hypothetical protein [Acidobacteriota bacterium]MCB9386045.1 hypothetical protein [Bryobacterales bacterium]